MNSPNDPLTSTIDDEFYMSDVDLSDIDISKKSKTVCAKVTTYLTTATLNIVAWVYELASFFELNGIIRVISVPTDSTGRVERKRIRENLPVVGPTNFIIKMKLSHASARRITLFASIIMTTNNFRFIEFIGCNRRRAFNNLTLIDPQATHNAATNYVGQAVILPLVLPTPYYVLQTYRAYSWMGDKFMTFTFCDNTISVLPVPTDNSHDYLNFLRTTVNGDYRQINFRFF
ncbi:hisS [Acrasis kona]|uniref:HisS n=1 Tax=Acrasis kona TaxID=1008807 RepID=A0AAW2Z5A6_9EUKA